jgi:putative ABC transport system substrate-binding protein
MRRRDFITFVGGAAAAWPLTARAQQQKLPVIGVLVSTSAAEYIGMEDVRRGLAETGFVEGRNVAFEYRWADGQLDRIPWMAADLIDRHVAVIFAGGNTSGVRALIAATQNTPIVFSTSIDPVQAGLVASLSRPGGHATGITLLGSELGPKKLELLHEIVSDAKRIGLLVNQKNPILAEADIRAAQEAGARLNLQVIVLNGENEEETKKAFAAAAQQGVGAILMGTDAVIRGQREQVAALALHYNLPTVSGMRESVQAGQLVSYGQDYDIYRQAGIYLGRILKGEKAGDLPVLQPTKFILVINLKTAKALGLTIPESFLLRADEVIE